MGRRTDGQGELSSSWAPSPGTDPSPGAKPIAGERVPRPSRLSAARKHAPGSRRGQNACFSAYSKKPACWEGLGCLASLRAHPPPSCSSRAGQQTPPGGSQGCQNAPREGTGAPRGLRSAEVRGTETTRGCLGAVYKPHNQKLSPRWSRREGFSVEPASPETFSPPRLGAFGGTGCLRGDGSALWTKVFQQAE